MTDNKKINIKSIDFEDYRDHNGDFNSVVASFCPLIASANTEQSAATVNCLLWSMSGYIPEFNDVINRIEEITKEYLDKQ